MSLRPSYTLPAWRQTHYSQRVSFGADEGNTAAGYKQVTFQGIRLDSLPSLISIHADDGPEYRVQKGSDATWLARRYNFTEYNAPMDSLQITLNEKLNILSDKTHREMWKLYRAYAPDSKMSFTVWRELRQVYLIRSDVLAVERGQSIYNPTNITIDLRCGKAVQHRGVAATQEVRINFWYFNDSLTLSQSAAATTSMLLSPSDVQSMRISPEAREVQSLMEMGITG